MKILGYLFLVALSLEGCSQNPRESNNTSYVSKKLYVKDTKLYSEKFLALLKNQANGFPDTLKVVDGIVISPDGVKSRFPQSIPLKKEFLLAAKSLDFEYKLLIERLSLTDISFDFTFKMKETAPKRKKGVVVLTPLFFLGSSAILEDDKSGLSFPATLYFSKEDGCTFNIYLDVNGSDIKGVVTTPNCFDVKIDNTNCPTLRGSLVE